MSSQNARGIQKGRTSHPSGVMRERIGVGVCHQSVSCDKPTCKYFLWNLFADGTGEILGGEYCHKHGKKFYSKCDKNMVRAVTKVEYIAWQVTES